MGPARLKPVPTVLGWAGPSVVSLHLGPVLTRPGRLPWEHYSPAYEDGRDAGKAAVLLDRLVRRGPCDSEEISGLVDRQGLPVWIASIRNVSDGTILCCIVLELF